MANREKLFVGHKIREIRRQMNLNQAEFAKRLSMSPSYVSQLEHDQRPVTANFLFDLSSEFGVDIASLANDDSFRIGTAIKEAINDPLYNQPALNSQAAHSLSRSAPELAKAFLTGHQLIKSLQERLQIIDSSISGETLGHSDYANAPLPYDEVRDYFHYKDNYINELDLAAEQLSIAQNLTGESTLYKLISYLERQHQLQVQFENCENKDDLITSRTGSTITVNDTLPTETKAFQLAAQIGHFEQNRTIDSLINEANFRTGQAKKICRLALTNYFAGALLMPYQLFMETADRHRYDVDYLRNFFGTSFEQVCHRLSNLQRPENSGIPFFFVRIDQAGNITKRHSATKFQFTRYGGSCPLWNIHDSFSRNGKIDVQIVRTPDGKKYLSIARSIEKHSSSYQSKMRRYAVSLGCELKYAERLIYSEGLDLNSEALVTPIGVSCRICEHSECQQRAFPPIDRNLIVDDDHKSVVPYRFR